MNKEDLLKEMTDSIGTKEPVIFFSKMVDVIGLLFNKIEKLEKSLEKSRLASVMAISWDPRIAAQMIDDEISFLRKTGGDKTLGGNIYAYEIAWLQEEYMSGFNSNNYASFCIFWQKTLGYHPFLEGRNW